MYSLFECAVCQYFWRFSSACNHFVIFAVLYFPFVSYSIFVHCFNSRQRYPLNLYGKILYTFIYATVYSSAPTKIEFQYKKVARISNMIFWHSGSFNQSFSNLTLYTLCTPAGSSVCLSTPSKSSYISCLAGKHLLVK